MLPMECKSSVNGTSLMYGCFHRELGGSTKLVIDVIRYDPPNVKVQETVSLVPRLLGRYCMCCVKLPGQRKQLTFNQEYVCYCSSLGDSTS